MQLESLRYYLEVIKAGSITKAASNIFISQQGLSKAIQTLEKDLHVSLLKRNESGKTVPTEAGQEVALAAQDILETAESLKERMTHFGTDGSTLEKVEPITVLVTTYLANILGFFFDTHEVQSQFSEHAVVFEKSVGKICKALKESPSDVVAMINVCPAIVSERMIPEGFVFDPIIGMDVMLKCSPDFIVGKKKSVSIEEVRMLPIALYNEPMLSTVLRILFGEDDLNVVMHTTNQNEIAKAVARGDAATFTDTFAESALRRKLGENAQNDDYVCVPIQGNTQFMAGFLSVKDVERSANCLRYESFCKKHLEMKYDLYLKRHPIKAL